MGIETKKVTFTTEVESKIYHCNRCRASEAIEITALGQTESSDQWIMLSCERPPEWLVVIATTKVDIEDVEPLVFCPACASSVMEILQEIGTH